MLQLYEPLTKFLRSQSCKRYRPWNFPVMIYFLQKCETHEKTHFQGDISWYIENEEISSEVHRVEGFNSMNLWRNFFVLLVAREIVTGKNIFNKKILLWHSCSLLTFSWQNKREFWSRIWNIRVEIRKNTFISRLLYSILITIHGYYFYIWPKTDMSLPVYHRVYFSLLCVYNVFLRCFIDLFMIVNDLLLMLPT